MSRAFTRALDAALRVTLGAATLTLGAGCQSGDPKASTSPPPRCTDDGCCEAKIASILHGEHRLSYDERVKQGLRERLGEDGLACCVRLTRATDGVASRRERIPEHWTCCSAIGQDLEMARGIHLACTPWGPPMPPTMA